MRENLSEKRATTKVLTKGEGRGEERKLGKEGGRVVGWGFSPSPPLIFTVLPPQNASPASPLPRPPSPRPSPLPLSPPLSHPAIFFATFELDMSTETSR